MVGTSVTLAVLAVLVGIALPIASAQTTSVPWWWWSWTTTPPTAKPCGDFPWSPASATVDCDYSYYRSNSLYDLITGTRYYGDFRGRCAVNCADNTTVIGSLVTSYNGTHNYYYCHVDSSTWLGTEPRCEAKPCGEFPWSPDNATVDCDYSYYSSRYYRDRMSDTVLYGGLMGRCKVRCPPPLFTTGAPYLSPDGEGYFYCHTQTATWLGQEPQCQDDPCGPFPWQPTDATVDCDYGYNSSVRYLDRQTWSYFYPEGPRCSVTCFNNQTVIGASYLSPDGGNYYYCHPKASTWLGIEPSCQEKPCGDFPWSTADVTADCDYDFRETWTWPIVLYIRGRCRVSCLNAVMLVGPLADHSRYYSCSVNNASWTGSEPVCIGEFNMSSVTEMETNRVRLVGGDFYGCMELYDNVTQQWGPVVGFTVFPYGDDSQMAWADLACRDVGFTEGLATQAFPNGSTRLQTISDRFYPSYSRPNQTGPNFFLDTSYLAMSAGGVQHLHDTVERVVRGECTATENRWYCDQCLMCLACQKEPEIQGVVSCNSTSMWVSFRRDDLVRHDESSMHLQYPSCTADVNVTHVIFSTALNECGTTALENATTNKIVYTNSVFAPLLQSTPDGGNVITRTTKDRWTFSCHYVRDDSVAVGSLFPVPAPSVVVLHGDGTFTFNMNLYPSDSFSQPYARSDFPVEVSVTDDVYFGISVEAVGSGLVLFVDNCKATPSSTPGGSTEYYIIQDGCHQDDTLQEFTTASATSAQYGISAFKFTNESLPYVYLHCDVMVCLENNPGSRCDQGCLGARRRRQAADSGVEERATLVQGPILVLVPDETPDACTQSCHLHAACNLEARRCVCEPGWVGDGVHCQDFDECTIVSCGVHQRCVNTPGSHLCECMPGYMEVDGGCQAVHAYYSTYRLLARSFSAALQDPESLEYIDLVAEVVSTLESLYRRTSLAGDFFSVTIIAFRPGSVLVDHVINIWASADFSPAMTSEEVRVLVEKANGTALGIDVDQIVITDHDECSEPEKTDCSPHAACLNTVGSFSCSCIMGYQDQSPDVASRPGRVCELEGVSDSWVPAAAGAAGAAAVVIIAIATARFLYRAKRKNRVKDVGGHDNLAFVQTAAEPGGTASSDPYRTGDSSC